LYGLSSILATGSITAENFKHLNCNNFEKCVKFLFHTHGKCNYNNLWGKISNEKRKSLLKDCEKKHMLKY
jgi:hypothetical protein